MYEPKASVSAGLGDIATYRYDGTGSRYDITSTTSMDWSSCSTPPTIPLRRQLPGGDVTDGIERFADDIAYVHLKDIDPVKDFTANRGALSNADFHLDNAIDHFDRSSTSGKAFSISRRSTERCRTPATTATTPSRSRIEPRNGSSTQRRTTTSGSRFVATEFVAYERVNGSSTVRCQRSSSVATREDGPSL